MQIIDYLVFIIIIIVGVIIKLKGGLDGGNNKKKYNGIQDYSLVIKERIDNLQSALEREIAEREKLDRKLDEFIKSFDEHQKLNNAELIEIIKIVYDMRGSLKKD